jgi:hypothetical protein
MMVLEFVIWGAWLPLIFSPTCPASVFPRWQRIGHSERLPGRGAGGDVFQQSVCRPEFRGGEIPGLQPIRRRVGHGRAGLHARFLDFFALMLLHCLLYVPTLSIVNSIAFANLKDSKGFWA